MRARRATIRRGAILLAVLAMAGLLSGCRLTDVIDVRVGDEFACALGVDQRVRCWGDNAHGQLGNGTTTASNEPVTVAGLTNVTSIDLGAQHACAIRTDGTARCWGRNAHGQLGNGTTTDATTPVVVTGLTSLRDLATGQDHTCAVDTDLNSWCWGSDLHQQLGPIDPGATNTTVPTALGFWRLSSLEAGAFHTCGQYYEELRCWGSNTHGQLGDGTTEDSEAPLRITHAGDSIIDIQDYDLGARHTCLAQQTGGTTWCWGDNWWGQLGDGTATNRLTATQVPGLSGTIDITAGGNHTCIARADGTSACWGLNGAGELADGTNLTRLVPTPTLATGTDRISAGGQITCFAHEDGTVRCAGMGLAGGLGNGIAVSSSTPQLVGTTPPLTGSIGASAGGDHTCEVSDANRVRCFGANAEGQLGLGDTTARPLAAEVPGIADATQVSAGGAHTCVRRSNATVACWGRNLFGQLGQGSTSVAETNPVTVPGITDAAEVTAGENHTCVRRTGGQLLCFGSNTDGQLGNSTFSQQTSPVAVSGIVDAVDVDAGATHTCAVLLDTTARCWGRDADGQLGDGAANNTNRSTPVTVSGLTNAEQISAGGSHSCVVRIGGTAMCWGKNADGRPGDGTTTARSSPVFVSSLPTASRIDAGGEDPVGGGHTCAALADQTVRCWGYGDTGRLGTGASTGSTTPVAVTGGLTGVTSVTTGVAHTCAVTGASGGSLRCWGFGVSGQTGDGWSWVTLRPAEASSPVL